MFPDTAGDGRLGDARFCGARALPLSGVGRSGVLEPPKLGISSSFKSSSLSSLEKRSKVYMRLFGTFSCSYIPAGMYWGVAG